MKKLPIRPEEAYKAVLVMEIHNILKEEGDLLYIHILAQSRGNLQSCGHDVILSQDNYKRSRDRGHFGTRVRAPSSSLQTSSSSSRAAFSADRRKLSARTSKLTFSLSGLSTPREAHAIFFWPRSEVSAEGVYDGTEIR